MDKNVTVEQIRQRYQRLAGTLDERSRRAVAASEALSVGRGGVTVVVQATGLSHATVELGIKELQGHVEPARRGRIRREGGGRKPLVSTNPVLLDDLKRLVDPATRGDPESPLLWSSKSVRKLATAMGDRGHRVSYRWVARELVKLGYSLQANRKTREGGDHPDRDAQFEHINDLSADYLAAGDPVISVDAKKKELVGDFKNGGHEWQPVGHPEEVRVYDFKIPELGRVTPYGVYDVADKSGWVSVGIDHNTAAFAVATIERWWQELGQARYAHSTRVLITADGGGSNGSRSKLWKREVQRLADTTGLTITVCHFPPGTSKWNKIEHQLFSFITKNWRAVPLVSYAVIVSLIASTTTTTGLTVYSDVDANDYPTGIHVTDEEIAALNLEPDPFHGEWNYTIRPGKAC
jgi:hypothetical protein